MMHIRCCLGGVNCDGDVVQTVEIDSQTCTDCYNSLQIGRVLYVNVSRVDEPQGNCKSGDIAAGQMDTVLHPALVRPPTNRPSAHRCSAIGNKSVPKTIMQSAFW